MMKPLSNVRSLALIALLGASLSPQAAQATVVGDVSLGQRAGMQQLYQFAQNGGNPFHTAPIVDNTAAVATGSFSRVAYYVELSAAQADPFWVWVSMDTFNANDALVGVPKAGSGIIQNGTVVNNLVIESNHPNLASVTGSAANGIIEFWSSNYNQNGGGAFGSSNTKFDWKDSGGNSTAGHGSFQVFAFTNPTMTNAVTLFGITGGGNGDGGAGIGDQIPNGNGGSQDWTFGPGYTSYAVRSVEVWVGNAVIVPEPATATLGLLGMAGLMMRRRKMA